MRRLGLLLLTLSLASPAWARQRIAGFCEQGNTVATVGGLSSTTLFQQSFPGATVTVYATGTTNLSTIYSDNIGTLKANPFTLTPGDGYWFAYADNGRYDVKCSGTGIASPFTRSDFLTYDSATTVIAITSGGTGQTTAAAAFNALSPLTTSGDLLYGGASGAGTRMGANATATNKYLQSVSSGIPTWAQIAAADLTNGTSGTGTVLLNSSPTIVTPTITPSTSTTVPAMEVGALANTDTNAQVVIGRNIDDTGGVGNNSHDFAVISNISRTGGAVGSDDYDCRGQHSGTANYDHYACVQNGHTYGSSGTMTNWYGFVDISAINSGTVTNRYGVNIADYTGAGTVTNDIGIDVKSLTKGSTLNYSIQTEGTTKSNFGGEIRGRRYTASNASALIAADVSTISAGWGASASVGSIAGTDSGAVITIASAGAGQAANPSIILTFHDGAWTNAAGNITPIVVVNRQDANAPTTAFWTQGCTATTCTFTFQGTPVAGTSYSLEFIAMGR